jgi:integrase
MAWQAAVQHAGLLESPGLAAHWRPETKRWLVAAYGRFLTFLAEHGWLDPQAAPGHRLTPDRLRAYLAELTPQIAPATLFGRIRGLAEAMRVLAPGHAFPYLNLVRRRLKARNIPTRDKRSRMVSSKALFDLGLDLMEKAETGTFWREMGRATTYRDGLIIAILACRPLRRANFAGLRLGRHVVLVGDGYRLALDGTETKNHRPYASHLHTCLTPFIERYLSHYRPFLLDGANTDQLWVSMGGRGMTHNTLHHVVITRTGAAFGRSVSPHLFRDCAVTSLGVGNPEHVWVGMRLLHHADPRTTERHYDQALADHAVRHYQSSVQRQRQSAIADARAKSRLRSLMMNPTP